MKIWILRHLICDSKLDKSLNYKKVLWRKQDYDFNQSVDYFKLSIILVDKLGIFNNDLLNTLLNYTTINYDIIIITNKTTKSFVKNNFRIYSSVNLDYSLFLPYVYYPKVYLTELQNNIFNDEILKIYLKYPNFSFYYRKDYIDLNKTIFDKTYYIIGDTLETYKTRISFINKLLEFK